MLKIKQDEQASLLRTKKNELETVEKELEEMEKLVNNLQKDIDDEVEKLEMSTNQVKKLTVLQEKIKKDPKLATR